MNTETKIGWALLEFALILLLMVSFAGVVARAMGARPNKFVEDFILPASVVPND